MLAKTRDDGWNIPLYMNRAPVFHFISLSVNFEGLYTFMTKFSYLYYENV